MLFSHQLTSRILSYKQPAPSVNSTEVESSHRQKRFFIYALRVTLVMSDSMPSLSDCGLPGLLYQRGSSPGKEYQSVLANTGLHNFQSTAFYSLAAKFPEQLVLPEPLQPKAAALPSTPGPHRDRPRSQAASGANLWRTHMQRWNKTAIETKGQGAKEEDSNLPTSCRS